MSDTAGPGICFHVVQKKIQAPPVIRKRYVIYISRVTTLEDHNERCSCAEHISTDLSHSPTRKEIVDSLDNFRDILC